MQTSNASPVRQARGEAGDTARVPPAHTRPSAEDARELEAEVTHVARARLTTRVRLASAALSAGLVALTLLKVHLGTALDDAAHVSGAALAAALVINVPVTVLRAWRGRIIVAALGWRIPVLRMVGTQLVGQVMSWLTPAASGDLIRPYLWLRHDSVGIGSGVAVVVFERVVSFGLLTAAGMALCAPLILPVPAAAAVAVVAVVLAGVPWIAGRAVSGAQRGAGNAGISDAPSDGSMPTRPSFRHKARVQLGGLVARTGNLAADGRLMTEFTAISGAVFVLSAWQLVLLAGAAGFHLALWNAIGIYALSQVVAGLSSIPFGLGAGDAVIVGLLAAAGCPLPTGVLTAVLVRLTATLPLGLAGAIAHLLLGTVQPARRAAP